MIPKFWELRLEKNRSQILRGDNNPYSLEKIVNLRVKEESTMPKYERIMDRKEILIPKNGDRAQSLPIMPRNGYQQHPTQGNGNIDQSLPITPRNGEKQHLE